MADADINVVLLSARRTNREGSDRTRPKYQGRDSHQGLQKEGTAELVHTAPDRTAEAMESCAFAVVLE